MTWKFEGSCFDGEEFLIDDIDVWKLTWMRTGESKAMVVDPRYGQSFAFPVYQISSMGVVFKFAAGEFSNGVWGFYREQQS